MFIVDWFYGVLASLGLWQKEAKILFLGPRSWPHDAGRTKLLHMLTDEPTQDSTSVELSIGKIKFKVFDLGSYQIARRVLKDYKVDAVVYLVDKYLEVKSIEYDANIFAFCHMYVESREELLALLSDESLENVPFLILGNMADNHCTTFEEAFEKELCYDFGLSNLTTGKGNVNLANANVRPLEVFKCNFVRKMGYEDGFKWLSQYIN